jgi:hypothetical protein
VAKVYTFVDRWKCKSKKENKKDLGVNGRSELKP